MSSHREIRQYMPEFRCPKNGPAPRHTSQDWDMHKHLILGYYERMRLKELMHLMADQHDFLATEQQYKKKFRDWRIRKNNISFPSKVMDYMLQTMWYRCLKGKTRTAWRLAGQVLDYKKMRRLFKSAIDARAEENRLLPSEPVTPCPGLSPLTPELSHGGGSEPKYFSELLPRILPRRSSTYAPRDHGQMTDAASGHVFPPPRRGGTFPHATPRPPQHTLSRPERDTLASEFNRWINARHSLEGTFDVNLAENVDIHVFYLEIQCLDCSDPSSRQQCPVPIGPGAPAPNAAAQLRSSFYALARRFDEQHVSTDYHRMTVSANIEALNKRPRSFAISQPPLPVNSPQDGGFYGYDKADVGLSIATDAWRRKEDPMDSDYDQWWSPTSANDLDFSGFLVDGDFSGNGSYSQQPYSSPPLGPELGGLPWDYR